MNFGSSKKRVRDASAWGEISAALMAISAASGAASRAQGGFEAARDQWIAAMLPAFRPLSISPPYFSGLDQVLRGLEGTEKGERLALVQSTRRRVAEATERLAALARNAKPAVSAKEALSKRSQYGRLAKAMATPALKAQIESHRALLETAEKTPETAGARRELKSELAAFEREAVRRMEKDPKAPKAPKKEPKTPKAKRAPKEKKLKKPEMAARLLAHHAKKKVETKAKREKAKKEPKAKKGRGETTNELLARLGFTKELTKDVPGSFGGGAHVLKNGKKLFTGTSLQVHAWLKKQADKL